MCIGHGRKDAKVHKFPDGGFLLGAKGALEGCPEEDSIGEDIGLGGALRLHQNFNSTSCANCNNMIFLSAKNYREARVGGSSFLFCRDTCWEEWMAWFCKTEDASLQPSESGETAEDQSLHDSLTQSLNQAGNLSQTQSLPMLPENLKRTYSLQGMVGVSSGNRPLSSAFKRTSVGIL